MPVWLSLVMGTAVTIVPQLISTLNPELQGIATGVLAMATSIYHLYQPTPGTQAN
jgi:hypothetical protein